MKVNEMRERTIEELAEDVLAQKKRLFELNLSKSMHKLENTAEISQVKTKIAQLKTIIREKQLLSQVST